ncbi:DsbA family protein [Paragemmobacter ruber]|uniref:Thioredoxin domain-containing protein n=1 Tax=Paragemmobacter ruber TaxID=1985673 RepID=A0ABW9Y7F9_9RHOB|nr:DsbA family protein [Rhodobacter ruber]NBE08455.1 thioredoxin domain-containing protein [Rhodobacter ruber]
MRNLLTGTALALAFAMPGHAEGLTDMTDAERAAFRAEVRAYLLENPEVLIEVMDELEAREKVAAAARDKEMVAAQSDAIFNDAASWVGGNPDGDITVVEFIDYRCGYCRKAWQEVDQLVETDGNIRFVLKEYPILGEASVLSSRFAIAVLQLHGGDAYKQAHDALLSLRAEPTAEALARLAREMGLDPAPIMERMGAPEVTKVIEDNHRLAKTMEISGTPTFVVGGTMVRGYVPLKAMQQIVQKQRAAKEG